MATTPRKTTARKQPQDHKPKAGPQNFKFTHEGKTYEMPPAGENAQNVPAKLYRDLAMAKSDEERAQANLIVQFTVLESAGIKPNVLDVLYSMSLADLASIFDDWADFSNGEEVTPGESSGSSS